MWTVMPPRTRAPVITGGCCCFYSWFLLGLKNRRPLESPAVAPDGAHLLVHRRRALGVLCPRADDAAIGGRRGIEPTDEQVGAYEFVKSNDGPLSKAVLKAVFDDYARIRKGFRSEDWEGLGTNVTQVNQARK